MNDHAPTLVFRDEYYDGQLVRTLAKAAAGLADVGEAIATARAVGKPDVERWYTAWSERARAVEERAAKTGDPVSARGAYLRASEYHRQSYFFLRHDLTDARLLEAYRSHVGTFGSAVPLLDMQVEPLEFALDDTTTLSGWFLAPYDAAGPRPTVLFPDGYDSTAEEGFSYAVGAVARGFNAVVFDGPGQGGALYLHGLVFRPDFEAVVTPLVDRLVARPDVDPTAIILVGSSFAGYLALRAAAFEHRLAGVVVNPAMVTLADRLPGGLAGKVVAPMVTMKTYLSADRREFFGSRMAAHGVATVAGYFAELHRYDVTTVARQITCPVLAIECEYDWVGGGGPALMPLLSSPGTLRELSAADGAGGHCGGLGSRVVDEAIYEWIDTVVRPRR
jgi:cephalosporin-C deacetylase-like acetyl esterase